MRSYPSAALLALLLAAVAPTVGQAGFVVDGRVLSDWGVIVADNNGSNINSYQLGVPGVIGFHSEDQDDNSGNNFFLGPNHGGQDYDAEFLGVARSNGKLILTIVTGQRPDNGFASTNKGLFGPGDIRIVMSLDGVLRTYGIEVGGGAVNGAGASTVLEEGGAGSTYTLDSNGYTIAHTAHTTGQVAGSLWLNPTWINDPIVPQGPTQMQMSGGTFVGLTDYFYTLNSFTAQHAIIEVAIDEALFGGAQLLEVHWRPSCGNDELDFVTPEPSSLVMAGIGCLTALGASCWRRRRLA
jgi:hypothetical protein